MRANIKNFLDEQIAKRASQPDEFDAAVKTDNPHMSQEEDGSDLISPPQLAKIRIVANGKGLNAEAICLERFKCEPCRLNRKSASKLINILNAARAVWE